MRSKVTGIRKIAIRDAASIPPMTVVPNTRRPTAPAPDVSHSGTHPRMKANAVVVLRPTSSGRLRAASRKRLLLAARKSAPDPERSSRRKVKPPELPTPGMAGGGKMKAIPAGSDASERCRCPLMAV
jgi:hypothetical protein